MPGQVMEAMNKIYYGVYVPLWDNGWEGRGSDDIWNTDYSKLCVWTVQKHTHRIAWLTESCFTSAKTCPKNVLASDWRNLWEGGALTCQDDIISSWISHFMPIEGHLEHFWKKIKEGDIREYAYLHVQWFSATIFQKLIILSENWPVVKLVNANEHFLSQSPYYTSDCIWLKIRTCKGNLYIVGL